MLSKTDVIGEAVSVDENKIMMMCAEAPKLNAKEEEQVFSMAFVGCACAGCGTKLGLFAVDTKLFTLEQVIPSGLAI